MTTMYGIKNCDTIKKARAWLDEADIEYTFHDYKKEGVNEDKLTMFVKTFGWENVLNRRGTTWRQLSDAEKAKVVDDQSAIALMTTQPSMIKRPLIDSNKKPLLGFNKEEYQLAFK